MHSPNPDVFQCKICVSVVINWRGLGRVMRGIAGRGIYHALGGVRRVRKMGGAGVDRANEERKSEGKE